VSVSPIVRCIIKCDRIAGAYEHYSTRGTGIVHTTAQSAKLGLRYKLLLILRSAKDRRLSYSKHTVG